MSVASGIVGSIMAKDAQDKATDQNAANVRQTNKQNYQMWKEARGSGGSAVLPLYLRSKDGGLFEKQLGDDLVGAYDSTAMGRSAFDAVGKRFGDMSERAQRTADGIFNGEVQREMEANAAPVQKARISFSRQSALNTLHKTLGEIAAINAGKGFQSDSFGDRLLKFQANKGAADEISAANLENLEENRGIADAALRLRLNNLNLPNEEERRAMELLTMPDEAYLSHESARMQPLTFLRIGGAQPFQYQNLPLVQPSTSIGQILAQSGAQAGNMALNYWMRNQEQQNYLNAMKSMNGGGAGAGSTPYSGVGTGPSTEAWAASAIPAGAG